MKTQIIALLSLAVLAGCAWAGNKCAQNESDSATSLAGKADQLILGNIITMNEFKPTAEAMTVKNGLIQYVGTAEVAKALCDENTVVLDYGTNSIYPGFLEPHAHGHAAGLRMAGQAKLSGGIEDCVATMQQWMQDHSDKDIYSGGGWEPWTIENPTKEPLDAICPDKPMALSSVDGHSMWVNSAMLKLRGIDAAYAKEKGPALVHVDENGEPTGLLTESEAIAIATMGNHTIDDWKEYLLAWQDFAFAHGYTAAAEAGVELASPMSKEAYVALANEGKLKLRTFAYRLVADDSTTPEEEVAKAVEDSKLNSEYYKVIGMKIFIDGVVEAHTGWLTGGYNDMPGYCGLQRYANHDVAVRLIKAAGDAGLSVHAHTIGDGAVDFMLGAIAEAETTTGNFDMRNILVHLQIVRPEQIQKFAEYNIVAGTAPLWTPKSPSVLKQEIAYVGEERAEAAYPIASFVKAGAVNVSHTDYPVSTVVSIPRCIYMGVMRAKPEDPKASQRNAAECISRIDVLKSLTTNVAYQWHEEDHLGSLEVGKVANASIYTKDFLKDPIEDVANAELVATIVDGQVVYSAE